MGDLKRSAEDALATAPRCGRCEWWAGDRFRDASDATVGFTIHGKCTSLQAPPEFAGRKMHYLAGANCPAFKGWKEASRDRNDG